MFGARWLGDLLVSQMKEIGSSGENSYFDWWTLALYPGKVPPLSKLYSPKALCPQISKFFSNPNKKSGDTWMVLPGKPLQEAGEVWGQDTCCRIRSFLIFLKKPSKSDTGSSRNQHKLYGSNHRVSGGS